MAGELYVRSVVTRASSEVPGHLARFVKVTHDGSVRLDMGLLLGTPQGASLRADFVTWRKRHEAVWALGSCELAEQFVRLGVGLVLEESGQVPTELASVVDGASVVGEAVGRLGSQVVTAGDELSQVATSGWGIMSASGHLVRRDLALGGPRAVCAFDSFEVFVDAERGYTLVNLDEGYPLADAPGAPFERVDAEGQAFEMSNGGRVEVPSGLVLGLVGASTGVFSKLELSAYGVFSSLIEALARSIVHARSQREPALEFFTGSRLEPVYE